MPKIIKKMDAEMTAFAADVLESIRQAKNIETAQLQTREASKALNEITDEFEIKRLDIQPRSIDSGDSTND